MPSSKHTSLAYLALGLSICTIAFASILVRLAHAPAAVNGFYRMGIATLILVPLYARKRKANGRPNRKGWLYAILGGVFLALDLAVWNASLDYTSVAHSTLLGNTSPLWVALIALFFLHERLQPRFWLGLGLTMGGAVVVTGGDLLLHPQLTLGDALAFASAIFYAGYYLAAQYGRRTMDTLSYMWWLDLSAAVTLLLISLVLREPLTGYSLNTFLAFLGLALVIQVIGHQSLTYALGSIPASIVSATLLLQPVASTLLAIPIFGEQLHLLTVVGGLMVLGGVFLVNRSRGPQEQAAPQTQPVTIAE